MTPVDVALAERTPEAMSVALDWINDGHTIGERDAAALASSIVEDLWFPEDVRSLSVGPFAPLWQAMERAARDGRLIVVTTYGGWSGAVSKIVVGARPPTRLSPRAMRVWPYPAPLPCIGELQPDLGAADRPFMGTSHLAPAHGDIIVPREHALRAFLVASQLDHGTPWSMLETAIRDRADTEGPNDPLAWDGTFTNGVALWRGIRTYNRWMELYHSKAGDNARLVWNSGTGEPSAWIGRALTVAGILGIPDQPEAPAFGTMAHALSSMIR